MIPILPTSVTAFVGWAASDIMNSVPEKISNAGEYIQLYGDAGELSIHIRMFFENGGTACYVLNSRPENFLSAIETLKNLEEVTLIVIPQMTALSGSDYSTLIKAVLRHCSECGNRFALFDVFDGAKYNEDIINTFRKSTGDTYLRYGAAYFPFLNVNGIAKPLPASSIIAGLLCKSDKSSGIWKSPVQYPLVGVDRPSVSINSGQQELLNIDPVSGKSINAIRFFPGKGTIAWGARTLAGNDNEWKYIPVQRFCSWVKACIVKGLLPFSGREILPDTWSSVRNITEDFLHDLWQRGALIGTRPPDAFFVRCGIGQTMTANDLQEGRLIVELGLAVMRAGEFLILRIEQQAS